MTMGLKKALAYLNNLERRAKKKREKNFAREFQVSSSREFHRVFLQHKLPLKSYRLFVISEEHKILRVLRSHASVLVRTNELRKAR